jgi:transcriptional regulator with XRE-family HTH domain
MEHWQLLVKMLQLVAEEKGISQKYIGEKLGMEQPNISRIFRLESSPTLKTFIGIAQVLGVNFFFEDKDSKTELNKIFERAMDELGRRS